MSKWSEYDHMSPAAAAYHKRVRRREIAEFVDSVLPALQGTARRSGYALAVHGSQARDLDLIAVPWTERAEDPEMLVRRLGETCAEHTGWGHRGAREGWTEKPHGRLACTIIASSEVHLDISIMPRLVKPADQPSDEG